MDGKGQFSFQSQRKAMPKNAQTIALISHTSKVTLKILQARLQQYVNHELPDVQAGFRKGRGTRDQIANICWISPGISLEGMMLKLKLQYFGHLMRRVDSLEKDFDAGRDWGQEEKGTTEDEMARWT